MSVFLSSTRDAGTEVDVLRQEIEFLKTEVPSRLLSLRQEFQRTISDVQERTKTVVGTGTPHGVLGDLDHTSKKIVKDPYEFYDITKTGQLDFALLSLGGSIVSTRDTKNFVPPNFGSGARSAQQIIQACTVPGDCWAFEGSGAVVIRLIGKVNISAVSIEHASRAVLPTGTITSAPKDFSVWGLDGLNGEEHYLGNFTYNINGSPSQYFPIQNPSANSFHFIELKIHTNHGNPTYTCLYRFRVHGSMDSDRQA
jgi:SUN domain-containing protein 1/2